MKKITKLLLAATLLAAAMPSAAQTITVNKQTANCKQKTELFKPSVDLSKYNKRVVANGVEKYTKKDNPTRSIKKDAAEYVTVTFKYKYDDTKVSPDGTAFIFGDNNGDVYGSTEFFDYDEANNVYTNCVCQVPVGKYDVLGEACTLIDGGYLYGVVY